MMSESFTAVSELANGALGGERVAVVGGGLMGLVVGYRLAQRGARVEVFEAGPSVGGVMRATRVGGVQVDGFYHTILGGDRAVLGLIDEVGLGGETFFKKTRSGFYADGTIYPVNTPLELLKFKPLTLYERLRVGLGAKWCQRHTDWRALDRMSVREYLTRYCGRGAYENFWRHLLRAKYDGDCDRLPATAIWARMRRMTADEGFRVQGSGAKAGTAGWERAEGGRQKAEGRNKKRGEWDSTGYLRGGYQALVDRLAERIVEQGGAVHTNRGVRGIVVEGGEATGVEVAEGVERFDAVVSTVGFPILARMLPASCEELRGRLAEQEYMGVVCVLVMLRRSLSPYHTLYLLDETVPFTGIIETTHYIERAEVGGYHLVYLSKYVRPGSAYLQMSVEDVRREFVGALGRCFPDLREEEIAHVLVSRERYVDPIRRVGEAEKIPAVTGSGIENLYLVNTCQIYPRLPSGQAVVEFAEEAVGEIVNHRDTEARRGIQIGHPRAFHAS